MTTSALPTRATTRYVEANGLRFAYLEKGSGPLVVLLHGFPDNAETYLSALDDFATAGYRAVAPYLRGYAPTEIPDDGRYDPLALATDLEHIITALEPGGTACVAGMDWGGTTIHAALGACPQRIAAAVVMNAAHPATLARFAVDPEQVRRVFHFWFFQSDIAADALRASDLAMVDHLWRLWSPTYAPGAHLGSVRRTLAEPGVLSAALAYYPALFRAAQEGTFPTVVSDVPCLSIFGADDPTATYSSLEEPFFAGAYRRVVLDGVGHWPHLERRKTFTESVLGWFERFGGGRDSDARVRPDRAK